MNWKAHLPAELQPFLDRISATVKPCVKLSIQDTPPSEIWSSTFGCVRFWPQGQDWPTDENGRPLFGLLQLNLAELPALANWPKHGILQFFLSDDAFWGANPLNPLQQRNCRVVFHDVSTPATTTLINDFSFLPTFEDLPLQRNLCLAVTGEASEMPMPPQDFRFETMLQDIFDEFGNDQWRLLGAYKKAIGTVGHRLGGYASFIQDDPRSAADDKQTSWELLLQLDTDPNVGLMWGDYGVAHWFYGQDTSSRSLDTPGEKKLFERIWYGWESS